MPTIITQEHSNALEIQFFNMLLRDTANDASKLPK